MNYNIKHIIGMMLMIGSLLMISTTVFANNSDFRSNLTKKERIALKQEENRWLRPEEMLKRNYTEDATKTYKNNEMCSTESLRDQLSFKQGIALLKSEDENLSHHALVGMEKKMQSSPDLAMQNCIEGSVRKGLNQTELSNLNHEERKGR